MFRWSACQMRAVPGGDALFDRCASCQRCCHIDPGYGPLEVTLTQSEQHRLGSVCIETQCPHLSSNGCALGDTKPFACSMYPLSYDPHHRQYSLDVECPLALGYLEDFADPETAAGKHLRQAMETIQHLEISEPGFLLENHSIDSEFFDLQRIPVELMLDLRKQ